jgi:hypothetical protein
MPIAVHNTLPTLNISLGSTSKRHTVVKLKVRFDTCGDISAGSKPCHDCIRCLHPKVMNDYESSDDITNPFHPIKLSGAICDPSNIKNEVVGNLTAVLC